tara:strand:- start:679 stop:1635 length:957 start_codon:yes stop_codon:yes gene_type:complete
VKKIFNKFFDAATSFKVIVLVILGLALFKLWGFHIENKRLHTELIGQKDKYVQLSDHAAKLENQYVDQATLKAKLESEWANEKEALKGRVKVLSNATYLIREKARKEGKSDLSYEGKRVKYLFNEIRFKDGPPVGYVMIFDDGKVVSKVYNHIIDVKTAISRDEDKGRYSIVSKADFKLRSGHLKHDGVNWFNKPYPLKINGGTAYIDPTEKAENPRFYMWNPRMSAGFNAGVDTDGTFSKAAVGISLMGYGPTKRDLDYKFLHFGVGFGREAKDLDLHFVPVFWRPLREMLPNTYIGIGTGFGDNGQNYFMGINFNF